MRIAIFGAGGQLGSDLTRLLGENAIPATRKMAAIDDSAAVADLLDNARPDAVVNAAAYNFVDDAEEAPQAAFQGNAIGPRILARACRERELPLVHVSTDYVFGADATRATPYHEEDLPGPVSVYGVSKLAGEHLVRQTWERHCIVRTCGLYGKPPEGGKGNFVQTIRRLATSRDKLRVVDDQRCTPTSTRDLAAALIELLRTEQWGTYHCVNAGDCSWFNFASEIVRRLGLPTKVVPTTTDEFPRPARRPAYSVIDTSKLTATIGRPMRPWQDAIAEYIGGMT